MRVAIVHDWLTGMRGGEKVLSLLCELMPQADILTLLHVPGSCDDRIEGMRIVTSFLDDLPGVRHYYRYLLGLMPTAIESIDATRYDLIVSNSHCVAKGIIRSPHSVHLCYCHTPMRYVWSQSLAYERAMSLSGPALRCARRYLRAWDLRSAAHVDMFVANSANVAGRIRQTYRRTSRVVYPPVDTKFFTPGKIAREDFYLMVTALVPYKRVEQAIAAFAELQRPLRIIGSGPMLAHLRRGCPPNVTLTGYQSDRVVREHYRRCRALIFPGEEDFGLVPLEAMACGAPVIAYGAGGVKETVVDVDAVHSAEPTGLLYNPQSAEALADAVLKFERLSGRFHPRPLAERASLFSKERFLAEFRRAVESTLQSKGLPGIW
ncbi:MAG: glycosyltransferase [Planctomycetes bacterium]|nr:glycosyltransferase [Planctomycetota bacterium]